MSAFTYRGGQLHAEAVDCQQLAAEFGTPLYVYSRHALESAWQAFDAALAARPHLVCYAVKANSNIAVLNVLARLGSGFDIVSTGELERVLAAGGDPAKTVFSGVGKRQVEIAHALETGIRCFNVESSGELECINRIAATHGVIANVSLRINPDVDAKTHPYISTGLKENKFGIPMDTALDVYRKAAAMAHVRITGIDCHIGSQLGEVTPYIDALDSLLFLIDTLAGEGIAIGHLDIGGGQGIRYRDEAFIDLTAWAAKIDSQLGARALEILVEPGRAIAGNAGILLSKIEYVKHHEAKNFAVIDAAMNDLLRPSLYSAWHAILPVVQSTQTGRLYDVVGPVCESSDFLGKDRALAIQAGDLLAVMSAGAYAFVMSSNYNSRARAAEVMVDGDKAYLVRRRESPADLFAGECCLADH